MRKIKEVLRLRYDLGLLQNEIAEGDIAELTLSPDGESLEITKKPAPVTV
jgi:hypothetical protein